MKIYLTFWISMPITIITLWWIKIGILNSIYVFLIGYIGLFLFDLLAYKIYGKGIWIHD
jgi:hypothetical protein